MLVNIDELKHVLFTPLSRLIHLKNGEYSTFIMDDRILEHEKSINFVVSDFVLRVAMTEGCTNGFYLLNHETDYCYFILTNGGWDYEVEDYFFRAGLINFLPDKYTLPKEFYEGKS
jgi:hypothetical protein